MKSKKKPYLTSEQLAKALEESQMLGNPTEEVCRCFRMIATHLLGDSRYRYYPKELQEDMVSNALLKCIKNIKNYKKEFKDRCFNYYVRCVETSFWTTLSKYYQHRNLQRQFALEYADKIEGLNPELANKIRDSQIEVQHTGRLAVRPGWLKKKCGK